MIEKIMEPAAKCAEVVSKECVKKGAEIAGKIYSYEKIVDAPNDNKIDFGCNGMVNESSVAGNIVLVLVAFIIALIKRRKSKMLG